MSFVGMIICTLFLVAIWAIKIKDDSGENKTK